MIWVLGYSLYGDGDICMILYMGEYLGMGKYWVWCLVYIGRYYQDSEIFQNYLGGEGRGNFIRYIFIFFLKNSPKFPNSINYLYITYFIRISPLSAKFAYSDFIRYNSGISYLIKNENPPPPISYLIKNQNHQINFVSYKKRNPPLQKFFLGI